MRLKPLQKINHFTGMLEICRKKALARNLRRVAAKLPASFDFAPQTFVLPEELEAFADAVKGNRADSVCRKSKDGKKNAAPNQRRRRLPSETRRRVPRQGSRWFRPRRRRRRRFVTSV